MSVTSPREPGNRRFSADALVMIVGTGLSQALLLCVMPIVTRLYTPEAISLHAMLVAVAAPTVVFATMRLDLAIVIARDSAEVDRIARAVCTQVGVVSLGLLILTPVIGPHLFATIEDGSAGFRWMAALAVSVFFLSLMQIASGSATRLGRFRHLTVSNLVLSGAFAIVAIGLGMHDPLIQGVVVARTAGQIAAVVALWTGYCFLIRWLRPARWRHLRRVWSNHKPFLQFNTPYSLIGAVARDAPLYFFTAVGQIEFVAFYALARTVVLAPTLLVSSSISRVFHRYAVEHWGTVHLEQFVRRLTRMGLWCSLPAFALMIVWGDKFFGVIFGPAWHSAGSVAMLLGVPLWLSLQNGWPERLFEVAQRQATSFRIQILFDVANITALVSTYWLTGDALSAVGAFALMYTLYQICYLIALYRVAAFPSAPLLVTLGHAFLAMVTTVAALGGIRLVNTGLGGLGASCALVAILTGLAVAVTAPLKLRSLGRNT